jgi:hypothetical protein
VGKKALKGAKSAAQVGLAAAKVVSKLTNPVTMGKAIVKPHVCLEFVDIGDEKLLRYDYQTSEKNDVWEQWLSTRDHFNLSCLSL